MLAPPGQRRLYQIFLTHVALADEINLDAGARGQTLRVLAQTVPKRLGELRVIENPHPPRVQIGGHSLGVADLRQRSKNQHSIPTPQHACDLVLQSLRQQFDAHPGIISDLFGSGYAGLGSMGRRASSSLIASSTWPEKSWQEAASSRAWRLAGSR